MHTTIGIGTSAGIFVILVVPSVATSSNSSASGSQKNEYVERGFVCGDTGNVEIFIGEAI